MPNYFYTAKTLDGKNQAGNLNAKDTHELSQTLKNQGMLLIKAHALDEKEKKSWGIQLPFSGVSAKEKIMFTRNLWVMVSAGLSLVRSFEILAAQTKKRRFKTALNGAKERIGKGDGLYEALSQYPDIFSRLFLSMIKVGEESGTLEESFKVLSLQMEREYELKSKIKQAMIYPGIILATMLGIGILVTVFVLPKLKIFFTSLNTELPIYTKILIGFGDFASHYWYIVISAPIVLFIFIFWAIRTERGKKMKDTVLLKLPLISSLVKKNNAAFLIRSLSSLISSGVPLVSSLEITAGTVGNYYFKKALLESAEKVKKGERLSGTLKPHQDIFPFGAIEMMEVGEETGKTTTILKKLADFYEQEAIAVTESLSLAIEPMLILAMGACVAFFAFAVIQPMYSVLGAIE